MSDKLKIVITHLVMILAYGAAYAAVELTPLKDIPEAKIALTSAMAWLYGKLAFAPTTPVTVRTLSKMSPGKQISVINRMDERPRS